MRVFEICLKFGLSGPCLKHTDVRAYIYICASACVCLCRNTPPWTNVQFRMCRSETLSKYDSCNHSHALQPARRAVNSWADTHRACGLTITAGRMRSHVCVRVMVLRVCGWTSSSQPSTTHRFRRYYFNIVSSCVLVAKHGNHLPIAGFSVRLRCIYICRLFRSTFS